jgi:hypothetical protein
MKNIPFPQFLVSQPSQVPQTHMALGRVALFESLPRTVPGHLRKGEETTAAVGFGTLGTV